MNSTDELIKKICISTGRHADEKKFRHRYDLFEKYIKETFKNISVEEVIVAVENFDEVKEIFSYVDWVDFFAVLKKKYKQEEE